MASNESWEVVVETRGQCGSANYVEGADTIRFGWEFGGRDIIAMISGPEPSTWDDQYPWAVGRRHEIMRRLAQALIEQKASGCRAEFDFDRTLITLRTE